VARVQQIAPTRNRLGQVLNLGKHKILCGAKNMLSRFSSVSIGARELVIL
jgi:hypothetical protein